MVTVYLPMSSFPWGGLILLFAIAMVTLMASSALANYPYKFLRYNNNISHLSTYIDYILLIEKDYCTGIVNLLWLIIYN